MSDRSKDDEIVREAKDRFKRCEDWEGVFRARAREDIRFAEADSNNLYQWDDAIVARRKDPTAPRPILTVNKTRQHCLQIVNEARQNKASIRVNAVGERASYEAAEAREKVIRHVEYKSNATEAYEAAYWNEVTVGIGYVRVVTEYCDDKSFNQDIRIRRVKDWESIYLDPDIEEFDGSDARFGFVFRNIPKDEFNRDYPKFKDTIAGSPIDGEYGWTTQDHVRVAEYFRKNDKADRLLAILFPGEESPRQIYRSELDDETYKTAKAEDRIVRERDVIRDNIEWFKIAGGEIIDRAPWAGKYIPIARFVGEETVIDGIMDRKGHVRALKDPQRMFNYNISSYAEKVALESKAPYIAPLEAIEGLETYWNSANTDNHSVLPYKSVGDDGQQIPAPQRTAPPAIPTAYIQGLQMAEQQLMAASGQYQSQFGEAENAKSGIAIQTRQRQGQTATYHYIDHQAQAIKYVGRIINDLIPKIYDTERLLQILGDDGSQSVVKIDPTATQPVQQMIGGAPASPEQIKEAQKDPDLRSKVMTILNPKIGEYDVVVEVGPNFTTQREETVNALMQLMAQNKDLAIIAGDILFRNMDIPDADEIADRLAKVAKARLPPDQPQIPPEMQQKIQEAMQAYQQLQEAHQKTQQENEMLQRKLADKGAEAEVKTYDAETRRLATIGTGDPESLKLIVRGMLSEMLGMPALPALAAHAHAEQAMMPQPPETMAQEAAETHIQ